MGLKQRLRSVKRKQITLFLYCVRTQRFFFFFFSSFFPTKKLIRLGTVVLTSTPLLNCLSFALVPFPLPHCCKNAKHKKQKTKFSEIVKQDGEFASQNNFNFSLSLCLPKQECEGEGRHYCHVSQLYMFVSYFFLEIQIVQ